MDNIKIALVCVLLFTLSLALIVLLLASANGSDCNECDQLPYWLAAKDYILEFNQDKGKNYIIVPTNSSPIVFDIFLERREVYWAEEKDPLSGSTKIFRALIRGDAVPYTWRGPIPVEGLRGDKSHVVAELEDCSGLAVDWLHSHLYWTDREWGVVEVAALDGSHRRNVYTTTSANDITSIVVDPLRRKLFWLEKIKTRNRTHPSIYQLKGSSLKGGDVYTLVPFIEWHSKTSYGSNIVLDIVEKKIYFFQSSGLLSMCDYDGGNQIVVKTKLPMPISFSISRHQLFWMNKEGKVSTMVKHKEEVYSAESVCKDCTDVEKQTLLGQGFQNRVIDNRMQPKPELHNSTADDCLLNYLAFTDVCPCPFGYKTIRKTNTCEEEGFFLASFDSIIQGVSLRGLEMTMHFKSQARFLDIDFHFLKGLLLWFDSEDGKIYKAPVFNLANKSIVALIVKGTSGLAVDWVYDHLYWTNNNLYGGCIEVCKLDGSFRIQLVSRSPSSKLISIALDPMEGLMYFANWTEGTIEMAGMDGLNLQTLVRGGLQRPRSLTLDFQGQSGSGLPQARQLYWLESYAKESTVLKTCSLQNNLMYPVSCREVYSRRGSRPSSMTLFNNRLYWLDPHNLHHIRVDGSGQPKRIHVSGKHTESYALRVYHSRAQPEAKNFCQWSMCQRHSLCLPSALQLSQRNTRCVSRQAYSWRTDSRRNIVF